MRMFVIYSSWFLVFSLIASGPAEGASFYKKSLDKKSGKYLDEGVFIGGRSGKGFSLLNVRRNHSKKSTIERVVLDIGDSQGNAIKSHLNFFHVSLQKRPSRLVIDLSQVRNSRINASKLRKIFAKSPYVKRASLSFDPEDFSTNIVLDLRKKVVAEVFQLRKSGKPGRIVIDLKKKPKSKPKSKRT